MPKTPSENVFGCLRKEQKQETARRFLGRCLVKSPILSGTWRDRDKLRMGKRVVRKANH